MVCSTCKGLQLLHKDATCPEKADHVFAIVAHEVILDCDCDFMQTACYRVADPVNGSVVLAFVETKLPSEDESEHDEASHNMARPARCTSNW